MRRRRRRRRRRSRRKRRRRGRRKRRRRKRRRRRRRRRRMKRRRRRRRKRRRRWRQRRRKSKRQRRRQRRRCRRKGRRCRRRRGSRGRGTQGIDYFFLIFSLVYFHLIIPHNYRALEVTFTLYLMSVQRLFQITHTCDRIWEKWPLGTKTLFCVYSSTLKNTPYASCCNMFHLTSCFRYEETPFRSTTIRG